MMEKERLLVVGNGMAGIRAVEEVLARAPGRYDMSVFGAEPQPAYNRIMLSPVLAGETEFAGIVTHDRDWYAANGVTLHSGIAVSAIHAGARILVTEDGRSFAYDKLILATGSHPVILPVPGRDLAGVIGFRSIADVEAMLETARHGGKAAVIGGGLLGLEAACGLTKRGMDVTVIHLMPHLLERQIDAESAALLRGEIERRGIKVMCSAETHSLIGARRVRGVHLADGRDIPADLVVMAAGIRPNAELARAAGLAVGRGIVVDDAMRTSDPYIFAAGECAEHKGVCHGLLAPLYDMAKVLGDTLAGAETAYKPAPLSTRLKVSGIDLFSAGDFAAAADREDIVLRDPGRGAYRRLVLKNDRVLGAVLYGDTTDAGFYYELIEAGADVSAVRDGLIFGKALCEAA